MFAVHPEKPGVLFVQVTDASHAAARVRKVRAAPETAVLLAAGNRAEVHAWDQPGGPGTTWRMRVRDVE